MIRTAIVLCAALLTAPTLADTPNVTLDGDIKEGALIRGITAPGNSVVFDGVTLPVSADGAFVFGLHRDHDDPIALTVTDAAGDQTALRFEVEQREYKIQRIDGLPDRMVTPMGEETLARIRSEGAQKRAARPEMTSATHYTEQFIWPATGRISGVYGSQRILNGEPRNPHYGVDIAKPTGTPVKAPASGVITLAETDMYYEGGLVFIDHGHGVIGVLMHLDRIDVTVGQTVTQGEVIGTIGATGRATGPHLDWRMYWRGARVDPTLLVPPMPQ